MPSSISETAREVIRAQAVAEGFDVVRFASAAGFEQAGERLEAFVAGDRHGDMAWIADTLDRRSAPKRLWAEARSIVVVGLNYAPAAEPLANLGEGERATISVYARGDDYHELIKKKLRVLAGFIASQFGAEVKLFVDTAPLMEKPVAAAAGIGWQGKHSNLVSRNFGSWLFLGSIMTTLELEPDLPHEDHCGDCRRCLDICPTAAFPAPYQLDARRCISYLTIEHKGHIGREFRGPMGNRIYGCDDCLAVCPWNKFAVTARESALWARAELARPMLEELAALDHQAFRELFRKSPIRRIGRDRFVRNVLIAIGNSASASLAPAAQARLDDASPLVRAMAVWALGRLLEPGEFARLHLARAANENDPGVRAEWNDALAAAS
ncbi:MAG: tRNA epoxyqueuosine(34) reductase QueG [Alphaproteobacteria bacterium]|nr:tRNA epoxyqueuosine(34) reductase QueG [Alphaproteobacteria bacterium]